MHQTNYFSVKGGLYVCVLGSDGCVRKTKWHCYHASIVHIHIKHPILLIYTLKFNYLQSKKGIYILKEMCLLYVIVVVEIDRCSCCLSHEMKSIRWAAPTISPFEFKTSNENASKTTKLSKKKRKRKNFATVYLSGWPRD